MLRIDSPGGSAIASDVIWREVMLTRKVKPVIASMSDVAASGGYYIAMPAHAIVAQPATLTGSIGVVMHQVRHRRHAEEARDEHGSACSREATRTCIRRCGRSRRKSARRCSRADAGHLRRVRREGGRRPQHDARKDRRHRAGPRVDGTPGEAARAGRRARRARSRDGARQAAREDRAGRRKWSW